MMRFTSGDILRDESEALVNTVNCVGVMGRGIALQFKKAFPKNFLEYKEACNRGEVVPGKMFITKNASLDITKYIINFPTKRHWRGKSRIEDIEVGLSSLRNDILSLGIRSIAIPPLGSGLGGLHWSEVKGRIEKALGDLELDVVVYEPSDAPDAQVMARVREVPNMTAGRATLVILMQRYLEGLLDPFVALIELHKLMYFMQEAGEPLRLKYKKYHYGPYAENLRHVLNVIEGHMVSGYADGGDNPAKKIELVPGIQDDAHKFLEKCDNTKQRFERVSALVDGFESPAGLELLASVHWVIKHEDVGSWESAVEKIHSWNTRKNRFSPRQIRMAYDRLINQGWGRCLVNN